MVDYGAGFHACVRMPTDFGPFIAILSSCFLRVSTVQTAVIVIGH